MASKALYYGVLVDQIMQACHRKAHLHLQLFYLKDLPWSDNDMYLGTLTAAYQVLDPSPSPQEQKKGWAHPLQPSLMSLYSQGLGKCLPPQDVWEGLFCFLCHHSAAWAYAYA